MSVILHPSQQGLLHYWTRTLNSCGPNGTQLEDLIQSTLSDLEVSTALMTQVDGDLRALLLEEPLLTSPSSVEKLREAIGAVQEVTLRLYTGRQKI